MSTFVIGLIIALPCLVYFVGSLFFENIIKFCTRRGCIFYAILFGVIGILLTGPSKLLNLPNESVLIIVGMMFIGLDNLMAIVPIPPEIIYSVAMKENMSDENE